ncbi:hypothetical protein PMZ80_002465 [Knufia obscura]|uniref:DUF4484 domain-containing protein n=2 Tax=Knufia TaxID=430999 RepID=A0AAN8IK50_9EURO|nr:hypothetical protein PMZ80_002465 [Knufia obscura]KAK5950827.1 hypothetical protein OHC33_008210 [Knufia fluminis]
MAQASDRDMGSPPAEQALPAITALFLVTFDNRKGYTISWQECLDSIKLDGVVEFKSLPSGLHNVNEDLVYFVHDDHAGISAFLREDDEAAARNARMLSVGVLVPEAGRMGKSFLYAQELKELARTLINKPDDLSPLRRLWEKHKKSGDDSPDSPQEAPSTEGYQKLRAPSTTSLQTHATHRALPPHHPALAMPELLHVFGPLIFPLIRAALLQKRILILGEAPVETTCNFVYAISILSTISRSVGAHIPNFDPSKSSPRPLFNIGISDISTLETLEGPWIACTTDDVLTSKHHLFDLLVILPTASPLQKHKNGTYPKLINSSPDLSKQFPKQGLRATRRDARRITSLKNSLQPLPSGSSSNATDRHHEADDNASTTTTSSLSTINDHKETVEPTPWSVIAYTSLIWWASAGDRRSGLMEAEELANEQDEALLRDSTSEDGTTKEVAIVAYFHKLSSLVFEVLGGAVRRGGEGYRDDVDEEGRGEGQGDEQALLSRKDDGDEEVVEITEEDVRTMGLDVWSENDKKFVEDMVRLWWRRKAVVRAGSIECCGVRVL